MEGALQFTIGLQVEAWRECGTIKQGSYRRSVWLKTETHGELDWVAQVYYHDADDNAGSAIEVSENESGSRPCEIGRYAMLYRRRLYIWRRKGYPAFLVIFGTRFSFYPIEEFLDE